MKTILNKDWSQLLRNKSVQEMSDLIVEEYNKAVDKCIPKYSQQNTDTKKPIWMNMSAYRKVKRKHCLAEVSKH